MKQVISSFSKLPLSYLLTLLLGIGVLTYLNILPNELFYDDEFFIYNNEYVKSFAFVKYFSENVDAGGGIVSNYYRPLLLTLFGLSYQIAGSSGWIYHLLSLTFHLTAGVGIFFVLYRLFPRNVAFLTSLLFLMHPIQTESIAYASGISDPLYVTFIALTLLSFLKNTKWSLYTTPLLFLLALLSKEAALITLGLMPLCLWMQEGGNIRKTYKKYVTSYVFSIFIFLFYGTLRLTVLNFENTLNFLNDNSLYATNIFVRLFTFLSILPTYLGLVVFPHTLYIERVAQIVSTPTLFVGGVFIGIIAVFLISLRSKILFFGIMWFFISIIPASGITPINGIIYEHFLYLPSVGLFFLFSYGVYLVILRVKSDLTKGIILGVILLLCLTLMIRTMIRNTEWNNPLVFYSHLLKYNPQSVRALNNYGMALAENGKQKEAITYYERAVSLPNKYPQIYFNLGNSYYALGDTRKAEIAYLQAVKNSDDFYRAYQNLYNLYLHSEEEEKANALLDKIKEKGKTNQQFTFLYEYLSSVSQEKR